ncbi:MULTISPECIES: ABC transporter permease [unclassified Leucobacter]|uniref:ABC transporter permease n=1 Tax=unclassified Leucobacter TaxID=2621730 RepID=UPI001F53989C|nr:MULTISPECIES: ABC transporter permease [unclassified Leucobacter]
MTQAVNDRPGSGVLPRVGRWLAGPIPVSVVLALVVGAVFMLVAGVDPISGYRAMVSGSFGTGMGIANTLGRAIPIIGIGIGIALAFRAGIINLGTEGQAVLGALAGGFVAVYMPGPGPLVALCAMVTGVLAGAAWGLLAALLQNSLGVPILLATLLLNYPARYFSSWVIRFQLKDPSTDLVASKQIDPGVQLTALVPAGPAAEAVRRAFGPMSPVTMILTQVNWSLVIVAVLVIGAIFVNRRTRYGFEAGLAGQNPEFTRYGGVKPGPLVLRTMALSGGIAGLIGVLIVIGAPNTRMIEGHIVQTNYAWTALLVTLLALYRPLGVAIAGLFFGAIIVGSEAMGRDLGLSPQIAAVIQALVIILLAYRVALPRFRKKRQDAAPEDPPGPEPQSPAAPAAVAVQPASAPTAETTETGGER